MRCRHYLTIAVFCAGLLFHGAASHVLAKDIFQSIKTLFQSDRLPENKIIDGLKEALRIGSDNAVKLLSKTDGYYRNPEVKIPLPAPVRKVETILRKVGYGSEVDAFEKSMNRAAETAADRAKPIFWDTIKKMTISDARSILQGPDDAATQYFKENTQERLQDAFRPVVHEAMSKVGVTHDYQQLEAKVETLPFVSGFSFDLDKYVTDKALDGLLSMLAEEERKIRKDPAARVTDLLREVFGSQK